MANDKSPPTNKPAPPVIDTAKLLNVTPDLRGDNRPGVIPDQPAEDGINPITNLPEEQTAEDGVSAGIPDQSAPPVNPPILNTPKAADAPAPKGRKVSMTFERDYWPRSRPPGMDPETEYRVRAGETADIPNEEAMDLMEAGVAKRSDRRG